jgi:hypothetical protein
MQPNDGFSLLASGRSGAQSGDLFYRGFAI